MQALFQKHLEPLRGLSYSALDVTCTAWYDDYGTFKGCVKDLELMLATVMRGALDSAQSIPLQLDLLEVRPCPRATTTHKLTHLHCSCFGSGSSCAFYDDGLRGQIERRYEGKLPDLRIMTEPVDSYPQTSVSS